MKKFALIGVVLAIGIAVGMTVLRPAETSALNVNDVAFDPGAFAGTITLAGVTAGFAPNDQTLFGIMDLKELQCNSPNCNKKILPVRFTGKVPDLGDEVRVTGSFVAAGNGYLFASEQVEVVRNHKLGG